MSAVRDNIAMPPTAAIDAVMRWTRRATPADEAEAREAYNEAVEVWNEHERDRSRAFLMVLWFGRFVFDVWPAPGRKHVWIVWAHRDDGICVALRTRRWFPFHEQWSCCRHPLRADQVVRADVYELASDRTAA